MYMCIRSRATVNTHIEPERHGSGIKTGEGAIKHRILCVPSICHYPQHWLKLIHTQFYMYMYVCIYTYAFVRMHMLMYICMPVF